MCYYFHQTIILVIIACHLYHSSEVSEKPVEGGQMSQILLQCSSHCSL